MSVRNKAFLIGSGSQASLRYGTTEDVRWQEKLPFEVISAVIGGKYNSLYFLDKRNKLQYLYVLKIRIRNQVLKPYLESLVRRRSNPEL